MQLFILNRTNERQTKSVGRILLYALLFFIVTRIAVMLMLTGCTAIYMANTGSGWIGGTDALFRLAVFSDSRGAAFFLVGASGRYRCSGAAIWIYYRCFLAG